MSAGRERQGQYGPDEPRRGPRRGAHEYRKLFDRFSDRHRKAPVTRTSDRAAVPE